MTTETCDIQEAASNAAAIMFHWMDCRDRYQKFYDDVGDSVGGFVGIQEEAARAAVIFTEEASVYTPGEDYYWVEAIEAFADKAQDWIHAMKEVGDDDLHRMAAGSIEQSRI